MRCAVFGKRRWRRAGYCNATLGRMGARTLKFDVFGEIMIVEAMADGWCLFVLGADGKRRPAAVPIPHFVSEHEIAQYLDDTFHESATLERPCVLQIPT